MSEPKTFASLSPSLLARKGAARPAMRPQLQPLHQYHDSLARQAVEDDLGWNDMGHDHEEAAPAPEMPAIHAVSSDPPAASAPVPEVVRQQEAIAERIAPPVAQQPAPAPRRAARPVATVRTGPATELSSSSRRSALTDGRRAAFTLRVDAERHLKLRLACTLRNRSAQQIVTEALDLLLENLPEVTSLAAQVAVKR